MVKYNRKEDDAKIGEVIETRNGNRYVVLPDGLLGYIGNADSKRADPKRLSLARPTQSCAILGQAGEYFDQLRMHDSILKSAGKEVAFIYDSGGHSPCHAVVKYINGPWSMNRIGFCGNEPCVGPVPWCKQPDGGLCNVCSSYVEKDEGGLWRVKTHPKMRPFHHFKPDPHDDCYDDD